MSVSRYPIRVAVVSPSHTVRAGVTSLVAHLQDRAVVTDAVCAAAGLEHHDVVVRDLGAVADDPAVLRDLRRSAASGVPVVGLVYDQARRSRPVGGGARPIPLITLAVTPECLMDVLDTAVSHGTDPTGNAARGHRRLPAELTEQEFRVMQLIGAGLTNGAIAKELYVSVNTVKTYIRTAYRKLRVTGRSAAMLWAFEHGLAGGPDRR